MDEAAQLQSTRLTLKRQLKETSSNVEDAITRAKASKRQRLQARRVEDEQIKEERAREDVAFLAEAQEEVNRLLSVEAGVRKAQVVSLVLSSSP